MDESKSEKSQATPQEGAQPPDQDLSVGSIFDKRYELLSLLGVGAAGKVYKARDPILDRIVVVKILHRFLLSNQVALERFARESQTTSELNHHGIIRVYCHGIAEDGRPYLVMDYLEGQSMAESLQQDGPLTIERFFNVFLQVIEALSFAHARGIVHRDIKPSNIVLVKEESGERAVIVDFGIARVLDESGDQGSTKTGTLLGSSAYMSPEQCKGSPVDARSDIYSLGCTMFESLAGKAPFEGESPLDVMYKHLNESAGKLGKLAELPDSIFAILRKCLEKEVAARYQSMNELKSDLQKSAERQDTIKRRWLRARSAGKRNWRMGAGLLAGLLACFLGLAFYFHFHRQEKPDLIIEKTKTLLPADAVSLPRTEDGLRALIDRYQSLGRCDDSLAIARRWEKTYMNSPVVAVSAKVYVLECICKLLERDSKWSEIFPYLDRIATIDHSLNRSFFVAAEKARLYRIELQPQKGIDQIDPVLRRLPAGEYSKDFADWHCQCLAVEADCYFDLGNVGKALALYEQAIKVRQEHLGPLDPEVSPFRIKAIVALTRLGRKAEAESLLSTCLNAAVDPWRIARKQRGSDIRTFLVSDRFEPAAGKTPEARRQAGKEAQAVRDVLGGLTLAFLDKRDMPNYKNYCCQLSDLYRKEGLTDKAQQALDTVVAECCGHGDFQSAIEAEKKLLREFNNTDPPRKFHMLVFIADAYTHRLRKPALAKPYIDEAFSLIQEKASTVPALIFDPPGTDCSILVNCLSDSKLYPAGEADRRLEWLTEQCKGHDCSTLRYLDFLKVSRLVQKGKMDEALALTSKNLDFFTNLKPAEPNFVYEWLVRKAEVTAMKSSLTEALSIYRQALAVLELLPAGSVKSERQDTLTRIADVLWGLGRNAEALKEYEKLEKEIGPEALEGSRIVNDAVTSELLRFAAFCVNQHDFSRAAALYDRLQRACKTCYGDDCEQLIPVLYGQAELLREQHKLPEARVLHEKVVDLCRKYRVDDSVYKVARQALSKG